MECYCSEVYIFKVFTHEAKAVLSGCPLRSFPDFQFIEGYCCCSFFSLFSMPLLPEVAKGMTVFPAKS